MGREDFEIIRSNRRTISLEISSTGQVLVRAPRRMSELEIRAFVESKSSWLAKHLQKKEKDMESLKEEGYFTQQEIKKLVALAKQVITEKVMPDYRVPRKWLKEHGGKLMMRMHGRK